MEKSKVAPNDEQAIPRWIRAGAIGGRIGETRWKWFIIGVVLLAFPLFMGIMVLAYQEERGIETDLTERGVTANGTVLDKYTEQRTTGRSTSTYFVLEYSFNGAGGKGIDVVFGEQEVSKDLYNSVRIGDDVTVTYVRGEPEINRVEAQSLSGLFVFAFWMFALMMLASIYVAFATWKMEQYKKLGQRKSKEL